MTREFRPWHDSWIDAAFSATGFWRSAQPLDHFRTASISTSGALADLIADLLDEHPEINGVVEVGAGDGFLLSRLAAVRPDLTLTGVDLRARPARCPPTVGWCRDLWDVLGGCWTTSQAQRLFEGLAGPNLVVCAEWFDDLPCPVAVRTGDALRLVEVDLEGRERPGKRLEPDLADWASRWSPWSSRLEVGLPRDLAWSWLCHALRPHGGLALMIDYGHLITHRPVGGSLAAYRHGRPVAPRPAPDLNLTAAVAVDSLEAAGHDAGASTLLRARQSQLAPTHRPPEPTHPAATLADLVARSDRAALTSPHLWGPHWWLLQQIPATPPQQDQFPRSPQPDHPPRSDP